MNLRNIEYLIQEAFVGIWRNGIMAVASVSTVALSLAILGAFVLMVLGSHRFVERQLEKFEIAVYLPDNATQKDAEAVRDQIVKLPLTAKAELLSRDQEWLKLKQNMGVKIDLGGVTNNPLPFKVSVESRDAHRTSELSDQIEKMPGVGSVDDGKAVYSKVRTLAGLVRLLGMVASIVLCFSTVFIISNAIRLTVFARRHEIRIMQLVGATNWFIRLPLILEGMVIGAVGALVAFGLIVLTSHYVVEVVQSIMPLLRDMSAGIPIGQRIAYLVIVGSTIGAIGSLVSIRRFLKA